MHTKTFQFWYHFIYMNLPLGNESESVEALLPIPYLRILIPSKVFFKVDLLDCI